MQLQLIDGLYGIFSKTLWLISIPGSPHRQRGDDAIRPYKICGGSQMRVQDPFTRTKESHALQSFFRSAFSYVKRVNEIAEKSAILVHVVDHLRIRPRPLAEK